MRSWLVLGVAGAALAALTLGCVPPDPPPRKVLITRVSVGSDGTEGDWESASPSLSADGRYVAFSSHATNFVPDDSNRRSDVFVHDRDTGTTTRVSVASDGTEGDDDSRTPAISADGRYVAFTSSAANLVPDDTNGATDVFVHDRDTGTTTRVSVASDGTEGEATSQHPAISADGRYVAFTSWAANLVDDDTNELADVFVHDRDTGTTTRVSVASDGTEGDSTSLYTAINADGRYVAFSSLASNLVPGDTNGTLDVFVHDRVTGDTTRVSFAPDGSELAHDAYYPSISGDGRYVGYGSLALNTIEGHPLGAWDVFVHDRTTGSTIEMSVAANGRAGSSGVDSPAFSADGRYVAFSSLASNLVPGDTNDSFDVFIHDQVTGVTERVSLAHDGAQGSGHSSFAAISADGRHVAFTSHAANLVPEDTSPLRDVFVVDRGE